MGLKKKITKQNTAIFSVIGLFVLLLFITPISTCNIDKSDKINKQINKIDSQLVVKQKVIDSLTTVIIFQDSMIALKKEDIKLIKPRYDKKIQVITALPADSISLFITSRYKAN